MLNFAFGILVIQSFSIRKLEHVWEWADMQAQEYFFRHYPERALECFFIVLFLDLRDIAFKGELPISSVAAADRCVMPNLAEDAPSNKTQILIDTVKINKKLYNRRV